VITFCAGDKYITICIRRGGYFFASIIYAGREAQIVMLDQ
jgi:hypothetical protein